MSLLACVLLGLVGFGSGQIIPPSATQVEASSATLASSAEQDDLLRLIQKSANVSTSFVCEQEGRFSDDRDCGAFHTCIRNLKKDGFIQTRGSCSTGAFSQAKGDCVEPKDVPGCEASHRRSRELNHPAPEYDDLCTSDGLRCGDCKHFISCNAGKASLQETCADDMVCQLSNTFPTGSCNFISKDATSNCRCPSANNYFSDPFNTPDGFIYCPAAGDDPKTHQCKPGLNFDQDRQDCVDPEHYPLCHKPGYFVSETDCSKYVHCVQADDRLLRTKQQCQHGYYFDEHTKTCSDPCSWNWGPKAFECSTNGRYADPYNCHNFIECVLKGVRRRHSTFCKTVLSCPDRMVWQPTATGKGSCVHETDHNCQVAPHHHHKCKKPDRCAYY